MRHEQVLGETPLTFLQNARIERAKRLLETTNANFDRVAQRVGYEDASSFRRLFVRASGVSPVWITEEEIAVRSSLRAGRQELEGKRTRCAHVEFFSP